MFYSKNIQLLKDSPSSILLITNQEVVNKKEDEIENDNQEDDISNEVNYSLEDSLELEEEKTNQEEAIDEEDVSSDEIYSGDVSEHDLNHPETED